MEDTADEPVVVPTGSDLVSWTDDWLVCPRCNERYHQIDNIGAWQCAQPVIGIPHVYVRADHIWPGRRPTARFTRAHDISLSREILDQIKGIKRARMLDESIVTVDDALDRNRQYVQDLLDRNQTVYRRYDYKTERAIYENFGGLSRTHVFYERVGSYFFPDPVVLPRGAL